MRRALLRSTQLSLKDPDDSRCLQARNHLHLASSKAYQSRGLSTGITRLQRSYTHPTFADAAARRTLRPPSHQTGLPDYPNHLSNVPCPLPRRIERVHMSIALLTRPSLVAGGSASTSRPAQASLVTARRIAQPPTGDLCHEAPTRTVTRISRSSATDQSTTLRVDSSSTDDSRLRGASGRMQRSKSMFTQSPHRQRPAASVARRGRASWRSER